MSAAGERRRSHVWRIGCIRDRTSLRQRSCDPAGARPRWRCNGPRARIRWVKRGWRRRAVAGDRTMRGIRANRLGPWLWRRRSWPAASLSAGRAGATGGLAPPGSVGAAAGRMPGKLACRQPHEQGRQKKSSGVARMGSALPRRQARRVGRRAGFGGAPDRRRGVSAGTGAGRPSTRPAGRARPGG